MIFISDTIRKTASSIRLQDIPKIEVSDELDKNAHDIWNGLNSKHDDAVISLFKQDLSWMDIYNRLKSTLDFYSIDERDALQKLFYDLQKAMKEFPYVKDRSCKKLFPSRLLLENYLKCYYSLAKFIFTHNELLYQELVLSYSTEDFNGESRRIRENETDKVETLGQLLTHAPAMNNCSIYSPYCAEALLTLYDSLLKLYKTDSDPDSIDSYVKAMINGTFAIKANRRFRHYVIRDNMQALLSCENTHSFLEKKSTNLSSYELIRPIRLFGKIKRHADCINEYDIIPITIIGGVYIDDVSYLKEDFLDKKYEDKNVLRNFSYEMFDLYNWLSVDPSTKDRKFDFDIHINRNSVLMEKKATEKKDFVSFHLGNINIIFIFDDYNEICRKDRFDKLIFKNQLLLILDCPFIYENVKVMLSNFSLSEYFRFLPEVYSSSFLSLSEPGLIQMIQMQINAALLCNLGRIGFLTRKLREPFLEYVSNSIKAKTNSEAFIFISSQRSVNSSRYIRQYVVRTEKYNGKEIGLLHFGEDATNYSNIHQEYEGEDKNNFIVFSLWNLIVNTDVTLASKLRSLSDVSECFEYDASNVLIKLEWRNSSSIFDQIKISITKKEEKNPPKSNKSLFYDEEKKEKVKSIISSYFNVLFNNSGVLESVVRCMQNSFYNVFFSKIDNIFGIIAFQRLREKLEKKEKIEINSVEIVESNKIIHKDKLILTSYKKMYVDIISNFSQDVPSESVRDILVSIMRDEGMDVYNIYDNIICAYEKLKLTDTSLYKNIIAARERL